MYVENARKLSSGRTWTVDQDLDVWRALRTRDLMGLASYSFARAGRLWEYEATLAHEGQSFFIQVDWRQKIQERKKFTVYQMTIELV